MDRRPDGMTQMSRRPSWLGVVGGLLALLGAVTSAGSAVKPRIVVIAPFNIDSPDRDRQWVGEGVAELLALGLAQHPALVAVDRTRIRPFAKSETWTEAQVLQAT